LGLHLLRRYHVFVAETVAVTNGAAACFLMAAGEICSLQYTIARSCAQ
jgi:hypothetical protein